MPIERTESTRFHVEHRPRRNTFWSPWGLSHTDRDKAIEARNEAKQNYGRISIRVRRVTTIIETEIIR